jgi:hypothetical protein
VYNCGLASEKVNHCDLASEAHADMTTVETEKLARL